MSARGRGGGGIGGGGSRTRRRKRSGDVELAFSRENYVKANFRFALEQDCSTSAIRGLDDMEWDDVSSVYVQSEAPVICPVCLDQVQVPRMTACGHIYCMVCIMRLFTHSTAETGEVWERCPLCFAFISESSMKRVAEITRANKLKRNDSVTFSLLKRKHTSIVPIQVKDPSEGEAARDEEREYDSALLPVVNSSRAQFSRMFIDTKFNVADVYSKENDALKAQFSECGAYKDFLGAELVKRASKEIHQDFVRWSVGGEKPGARVIEAHPNTTSSSASTQTVALGSPVGVIGSGMRRSIPKDKRAEGEDVYFYQLEDGRLIYLDPFNLKCLQYQVGFKASSLPTTLENVRILAVENLVVTPNIVKKFPFLVHVPIQASICLVEVDLKQYLSPETREHFKEEFSQREKRRVAKARADKRHEKKMKAKLRKSALSDVYTGYGIDYREYAERQRLQEEEIERQLAHAFDASLNGQIISPEEEAALAEALDKTSKSGAWGSGRVGSFASIVNSNGHFPELGASSTSGTRSLSSSPPQSTSAWGKAALASPPTAAPSVAPTQSGASLSSSPPSGWETLSSKNNKSQKARKGMLLSTSTHRRR